MITFHSFSKKIVYVFILQILIRLNIFFLFLENGYVRYVFPSPVGSRCEGEKNYVFMNYPHPQRDS